MPPRRKSLVLLLASLVFLPDSLLIHMALREEANAGGGWRGVGAVEEKLGVVLGLYCSSGSVLVGVFSTFAWLDGYLLN